MKNLADLIIALPEEKATGSRDFGRGYAQAIRDVLEILANNYTNDSLRGAYDLGYNKAVEEIKRAPNWTID